MSPKNMSEDITSEDKASRGDARGVDIAKEKRKQISKLTKVRRLRRCNVRMMILSVMILMVLCVMLLVRIRTLNGTVARLTAQVDSLIRLTAQQREMMEKMTEEAQSAMGEHAVVGNLDKETEGGEETEPGEAEEEEPDAAHKV